MTQATTGRVIGYNFGAFVKCPICVGFMAVGSLTPSGRDREALRTEEVERVLDQRAKAAGINREDETTFDAARDFPKRVREGGDHEGEECQQCGGALGTVEW